MKKNKMMRIASVLLIAVLLSTCAISGTFAKFASEYNGTAVATVANWKFNMNGSEIAQDFEVDLADTVLDTLNDQAETDVEEGFIAPGTKGSFNIVLENVSDVTAKYTVTVDYQGQIPITFTVVNDVNGVNIAPDGTATITVNWVWAFGDDVDDNNHAGTELSATVNVALDQVD